MSDRKFYIFVPLLVLLYAYGSIKADENCQDGTLVKTSNGLIQGITGISRNGRIYFSFLGVPYAKPPIGNLRFKAPEPASPWPDTLDATKDANICKQKNYIFSQYPSIEGSEDCLYLNVYSPKSICSNKEEEKGQLPVMIFMHYGAFIAGSSKSTLLGPEYFMDKNVILVTFNYRVGIFGFYSTLDDAAPGNWALKDQVLAMKWVQANIASFGGDPNSVTIFGQSAGAGSVHHHMLSPSSAGLFHRVIAQSGSALALWAKPLNELQQLIYPGVAQLSGCENVNDTQILINCMREVDGDILVSAQDSFKYFSIEPLIVFTIVTEKKTAKNPEPFLEDNPLKIIQSGNFQKVPFIMGVNSDEGILRTSPLVRQTQTLNRLNENFDSYMPDMLLLSASVAKDKIEELWSSIKTFYLNNEKIDRNNSVSVQGFTDLYTDRSFVYGSYQTALLQSYLGHSPIWFYNFNYRGKLSYGDVFADTHETTSLPWGVSHCDELLYLFTSPDILPKLPESDLVMSKILIKIWTNFATYGQPTPCKTSHCQGNWDPIPDVKNIYPMVNKNLHYLNISGPTDDPSRPVQMDLHNEFLKKRMEFWQNQPLAENFPGLE